MKTNERAKARRLRKDNGMSLKDISIRLGVSKSSVSLWVRDVILTPSQEKALLKQDRITHGQIEAAKINKMLTKARHKEFQEAGFHRARQDYDFL